jgi:peptidoglycan hydrolase FlgJ
MGAIEILRTNPVAAAGLAAVRPSLGATTGGVSGVPAADPAKFHRIAQQFEAMFMSEMLHQAHSKSKTTGMFRTGSGENAMQPFMDQALGDAVAAHGATGLAKSIERALGAAAASRNNK